MGNLSTILTAILCASAPLAAQEAQGPKTEQTQSNFKLGKETVASIRAAYEKGEYDSFLQEMNASYEHALAENGLESLIQMRQKEVPADFQEAWEQKFSDLQKQKNKDLLAVVSDRDDSVFASKVRSVAANLSTAEQEKAISRLNTFVTMAPNAGKNDDENRLIAIDVEYEYKLLHAGRPDNSSSTQEQQIALRMEKMKRMVEAAKTFQDHGLKQAVGLAAANFDARLARNLDGADLNAFVKGKVKPANEWEEKVSGILSSYQGQFSELMKDLADANR
jgi:hypothetical protein